MDDITYDLHELRARLGEAIDISPGHMVPINFNSLHYHGGSKTYNSSSF